MADKRGLSTPKTVRTPEVIASVEALVTSDRRISMKEIKEEIGISHGTVHQILTEDLNYSKKSARWVPFIYRGPKKSKV